MTTITTKAENWIHDTVEITIHSDKEFTVQGYKFRIGEPVVHGEEGDHFIIEITPVYSLEHSDTESHFAVSRDLKPSKWSDSLYHVSDTGIERSADSIPAVVAKMVAYLF